MEQCCNVRYQNFHNFLLILISPQSCCRCRRERRTSFDELPPGLIGEKRKWMLSEKDCRQLSSAAQQGQDTSTRGVKGTQETPTHQAPAHPLLYLLSFPSFLNLATSPADHRPLTSPHVTSETFVCLPQLEDVPDSTWCWDWEAAAWWCGGQVVTRTNQTKPTWGGFRNAWQDDKQLQPIPHRNDKADQNWN